MALGHHHYIGGRRTRPPPQHLPALLPTRGRPRRAARRPPARRTWFGPRGARAPPMCHSHRTGAARNTAPGGRARRPPGRRPRSGAGPAGGTHNTRPPALVDATLAPRWPSARTRAHTHANPERFRTRARARSGLDCRRCAGALGARAGLGPAARQNRIRRPSPAAAALCAPPRAAGARPNAGASGTALAPAPPRRFCKLRRFFGSGGLIWRLPELRTERPGPGPEGPFLCHAHAPHHTAPRPRRAGPAPAGSAPRGRPGAPKHCAAPHQGRRRGAFCQMQRGGARSTHTARKGAHQKAKGRRGKQRAAPAPPSLPRSTHARTPARTHAGAPLAPRRGRTHATHTRAPPRAARPREKSKARKARGPLAPRRPPARTTRAPPPARGGLTRPPRAARRAPGPRLPSLMRAFTRQPGRAGRPAGALRAARPAAPRTGHLSPELT